MFRTDRLQPPVRRVPAVDAGSSCLRLALVKSSFGRVEILREESFDLHEEGLIATEELKTHLQAIREYCGHPPIAPIPAFHSRARMRRLAASLAPVVVRARWSM